MGRCYKSSNTLCTVLNCFITITVSYSTGGKRTGEETWDFWSLHLNLDSPKNPKKAEKNQSSRMSNSTLSRTTSSTSFIENSIKSLALFRWITPFQRAWFSSAKQNPNNTSHQNLLVSKTHLDISPFFSP